MYAYTSGYTKSHFILVSLGSNVLGYLDAIIRFPMVPQLESIFCLKLVSSVIAKTIAYSTGFHVIHNWALLFLSALFLNVWLLPVLYVLVVPYGDSSPFRKDRDILVGFFAVIRDKRELRQTFSAIRLFFQIPIRPAPTRSEVYVNSKHPISDKTWI